MKILCNLSMALALSVATNQALAADFSDPTWPCIQRKVERLSVGLMWPDPKPEITLTDSQESAVKELAAALSLQRVDMETAGQMVTAFAQIHGAERDLMQAVFTQVFDTVGKRRTRIINGIGNVSTGQIKLAERIDETRSEMDRLMNQPEPDYDRVDALEEQLDWDDRIYRERQQSVTYLCESPVLLEKRLFALANLLQNASL
ncbi:MAG: hypothetical protein MRY81_06935 [Donghicola eburneus]|jgi:hypothetical protein|nr:hypothetical protein [Donghicola eburneus]MCI5039400.1 hypothetical protein [Donghicola eburneus]